MASFNAQVLSDTRSATISSTSDGYRVAFDAGARLYRRYEHALNAVRDYLGEFLAAAEQNRDLGWRLTVSVSTGTAAYGTLPAQFSIGGVPVPPDEELSRIRRRYREGDGPIAALANAIQIARAYPPDPARLAA